MTFDFVWNFVNLFKGTEAHPRYATWAGLSTISAVLERRIWLDLETFVVYPNFYMVFVGSSGGKKSTTILQAQKLLKRMSPGPKLISQQISASALIDALRTVKMDNEKHIQESCGGMLVSDELKTFLSLDSYNSLAPLLINFYDCEDVFSYHTRSHGIETVDYVHLSLLAGTTIDGLRAAIPPTALKDGLASRMIFIHVPDDEMPPPVPRPKKNLERQAIEEQMLKHLQKLSTLTGVVSLDEKAGELYDTEYIKLYNNSKLRHTSFAGYCKRRGNHLLKIAVCIMLSGEVPEKLILTDKHIEGAILLLEDVESRMLDILDLITTTDKGELISKVHQHIKHSTKGEITRQELLRKFSNRLDNFELEKIIDTLVKSGLVERSTNQASQMVIRLKGPPK